MDLPSDNTSDTRTSPFSFSTDFFDVISSPMAMPAFQYSDEFFFDSQPDYSEQKKNYSRVENSKPFLLPELSKEPMHPKPKTQKKYRCKRLHPFTSLEATELTIHQLRAELGKIKPKD